MRKLAVIAIVLGVVAVGEAASAQLDSSGNAACSAVAPYFLAARLSTKDQATVRAAAKYFDASTVAGQSAVARKIRKAKSQKQLVAAVHAAIAWCAAITP